MIVTMKKSYKAISYELVEIKSNKVIDKSYKYDIVYNILLSLYNIQGRYNMRRYYGLFILPSFCWHGKTENYFAKYTIRKVEL